MTQWYGKEEKTNKIICHIADEFSRLSAACFVPESIIKAILNEWMSKYGTCEKLLHDLGGELNGDDIRDLLGTLGVRISTTAAFSPFSNGIVVRHNSVLKSTLSKMFPSSIHWIVKHCWDKQCMQRIRCLTDMVFPHSNLYLETIIWL